MTTCDAGLAVLLPLFLLLVLPVGIPLVGLAWVARRRGSRAASVGQAGVSAVLLVLCLLLAPRVAQARLLAFAFLPTLAASTLAAWKPSRGSRVAALVAAFVPALVVAAWSVGEVTATDCATP